MPHMKLTDRICKAITPETKARKYTDGQGLYLEVSPTGSKYWRLKYRFAGKEKRLALGVYPVIGLREARERAFHARKQIEAGSDPSLTRRLHKLSLMEDQTNDFATVARKWHQHNLNKWAANTAKNNIHRLEADIFPVIGMIPIKDLTLQQIVSALQRIEARGASDMARRCYSLCHQVLRYALVQGFITTHPAANIKPSDILKPYQKGHFASIDMKDLPTFLQDLKHNRARLFPTTLLAIELMLLTFVRTSELIGATWDEIDLKNKIWIIEGKRMKMKRDHMIPLSDRAVAILHELKILAGNRIYVFPHASHPRKHMSNNTILKALERMGYKGSMTGHGFRALAMSTIKERLGYRHEVIDRQLAHAHRNKIDAAYDRAQFIDERTKMMQQWSDYISTLSTQNMKERLSAIG